MLCYDVLFHRLNSILCQLFALLWETFFVPDDDSFVLSLLIALSENFRVLLGTHMAVAPLLVVKSEQARGCVLALTLSLARR